MNCIKFYFVPAINSLIPRKHLGIHVPTTFPILFLLFPVPRSIILSITIKTSDLICLRLWLFRIQIKSLRLVIWNLAINCRIFTSWVESKITDFRVLLALGNLKLLLFAENFILILKPICYFLGQSLLFVFLFLYHLCLIIE